MPVNTIQVDHYTIILTPKDVYWIDFRVIEAVAWDDDETPNYMMGPEMSDGLTKDADKAYAIMTGFIKSDGCCQAGFDQEPLQLHFDSIEDAESFGKIIPAIYRAATLQFN